MDKPSCVCFCLPACQSVCLLVCLPVCLSACLSLCLLACLSVCLSIRLYVSLSLCLHVSFFSFFLCLSVCLSVSLSLCLHVSYLSFFLCLSLCLWLSVSLSLSLSVCLSVCQSVLLSQSQNVMQLKRKASGDLTNAFSLTALFLGAQRRDLTTYLPWGKMASPRRLNRPARRRRRRRRRNDDDDDMTERMGRLATIPHGTTQGCKLTGGMGAEDPARLEGQHAALIVSPPAWSLVRHDTACCYWKTHSPSVISFKAENHAFEKICYTWVYSTARVIVLFLSLRSGATQHLW